MSALQIAILVPVLPVLPLVITWWLPWERWRFWQKIPNYVAGPYLLYCAFAEWYFHLHWWVVLITAVWGALLFAMGMGSRKAWLRR
jgi:hypothetical protein